MREMTVDFPFPDAATMVTVWYTKIIGIHQHLNGHHLATCNALQLDQVCTWSSSHRQSLYEQVFLAHQETSDESDEGEKYYMYHFQSLSCLCKWFPRFPYCSRETLKANKNHSSLIQWVKQSKNHCSFKDWSQWWSLKKQKNQFCLLLLHIICRYKSRICHVLLNCTTNESMGLTYMNSTRWEQLNSRL